MVVAQRRRFGGVGSVEVEVPEAPHRLRRQAVFAELGVGREVQGGVGGRVDQQLEVDLELLGDERGEVAAGAVPRDRERALERPDDLQRVLERRRERVLGREPVVDADHARARVARERATHGVDAVEVAHDPAAAVQVGDRAARALGLVDPHGHSGDLVVFNVIDRDALAREHRGLGDVRRAGLLDRHLVRRRAVVGERVEDLLDLGVEHPRDPTNGSARSAG